MSRKQLMLLFLGSLVPWTLGNGLIPLLPVYALNLGASQALTGYYLSFAFAALAAGMFFAGWLTDKLQQRKGILIISGAAEIVVLWMMGQATSIWLFAAATAAVWFLGGIQISIINILAGLFAAENERGKVLGIIGLTIGLGNIIGGLSVGLMVDKWGYPTMFSAISAFPAVLLMSAIFVKDKKIEAISKNTVTEDTEKPRFGRAFSILLTAHLVAAIVGGPGIMGRSVAMNNLEFSATAITSTGVVSGLVSLPLPFILGWLSDRLGRKLLLAICYASLLLCMATFAISTSLWHFWIASTFFAIGLISNTVGTAFVTDLVDPKALGRGVSLYQGMYWVAYVIGLAVSGLAFENLGISTALFVSAVLPAVGIILVFSIHAPIRSRAVGVTP